MTKFNLPSDVLKIIAKLKRKSFIYLVLAMIVQAALVVWLLTDLSQGNIFTVMIFEFIFILVVSKFAWPQIRLLFSKERVGTITKLVADNYIDRPYAGSGHSLWGTFHVARYSIEILTENGQFVSVPVKTEELLDCYKQGDTVRIIPFLTFPIVENREPEKYVCPLCGSINDKDNQICNYCSASNVLIKKA